MEQINFATMTEDQIVKYLAEHEQAEVQDQQFNGISVKRNSDGTHTAKDKQGAHTTRRIKMEW